MIMPCSDDADSAGADPNTSGVDATGVASVEACGAASGLACGAASGAAVVSVAVSIIKT